MSRISLTAGEKQSARGPTFPSFLSRHIQTPPIELPHTHIPTREPRDIKVRHYSVITRIRTHQWPSVERKARMRAYLHYRYAIIAPTGHYIYIHYNNALYSC